jgi:hypothetical protein
MHAVLHQHRTSLGEESTYNPSLPSHSRAHSRGHFSEHTSSPSSSPTKMAGAAATAAGRGAFILFEGVDRCGKTTQANKLVEALCAAGQKAVLMRFPGSLLPVGDADGMGGWS